MIDALCFRFCQLTATLNAVFWDVDGTLADTEMDGHRPAFNQAFQELSIPFYWDRELYSRLLCISGGLRRVASYAFDQGVTLTREQLRFLCDRKSEHYCARVREGHVYWRPGVIRLLHELHQNKITQWIVTSSGAASVQAILDHGADILPIFDGVITSDDVSSGKPSPDGYLLALEQSGIDRARAFAIEDSAAGLKAAVSAGLRCLLTPSPWDRELVKTVHMAIAVLDHLGEAHLPLTVNQGPPCPNRIVTLKYLEYLLMNSRS
ncbi:HAD-IA family hydrolase [Synechococcus sp. M16CYN]|uniref:HAD-IA family hydrolase n=1 Tax=Synechococcus sp. M16CYN TaxID=3103139 RepID=UPI003248D57A